METSVISLTQFLYFFQYALSFILWWSQKFKFSLDEFIEQQVAIDESFYFSVKGPSIMSRKNRNFSTFSTLFLSQKKII